jgi:8-amino-7-oxononanoate synthase
MSAWEVHLNRALREIHAAGLHRRLREIDSPPGTRIRCDGRELVNFSSNDYLGLANHPALREAAVRAVRDFGAGAAASRLVCGSLKPFHDLEAALADFKRAEACLTFASGYAAALGTVPALVGHDDVVIIDKRVHACLVDAARLSGAKLRVFKHNDLADLERILQWNRSRITHHASRCLVITESVFSMDGDVAPLRDIVELKERHGAWLLVDEAHATGLFGERRSGLIGHLGLSGHVEVQMGTLGKAVGAAGGFICGSRALIDFLINSARSFIFSTAPVPASAAAARAGVELIQSTEGAERYARVWERAAQAQRVGDSLSPRDGQGACPASSPIVPLLLGDEREAVRQADALRERGFFLPAIRYPTVARGSARLRLTVTADHTTDDLDLLAATLGEINNRKS